MTHLTTNEKKLNILKKNNLLLRAVGYPKVTLNDKTSFIFIFYFFKHTIPLCHVTR